MNAASADGSLMSEDRSTALILVADDEQDIRELVVVVLEEDGYEVITASDGEEALKVALERRPDLCVLEVMMPKMDGCDLTAELRSREQTREVPVLLLSARTQWESVVRGKEAGADAYLTKPFVPDDLQNEVRALLTVPASEPEPAELAALPEPEPVPDEPSPGPGRLVLVAAADENVVNLVSYRLELGGYEVAAAHGPEEAMQLAAERPPDLCVLDPEMPAIDGHAVTRIDSPFSIQELYEEVEKALGNPAA